MPELPSARSLPDSVPDIRAARRSAAEYAQAFGDAAPRLPRTP